MAEPSRLRTRRRRRTWGGGGSGGGWSPTGDPVIRVMTNAGRCRKIKPTSWRLVSPSRTGRRRRAGGRASGGRGDGVPPPRVRSSPGARAHLGPVGSRALPMRLMMPILPNSDCLGSVRIGTEAGADGAGAGGGPGEQAIGSGADLASAGGARQRPGSGNHATRASQRRLPLDIADPRGLGRTWERSDWLTATGGFHD